MNRWKWTLGAVLTMDLLLLAVSVWTLYLPHGGHGLMSFSIMFPAWLIALVLQFFGLIVFEILKEH